MSRPPKRRRTEAPFDADETVHVIGEIVPPAADSAKPHTPYARARRLRTVRDVTMELSTIYAMARRGRMTWQDASRAAFVLRVAGDLLVAHDLEVRLGALEASGPSPVTEA
jgi:hypothetical protein